MKTLHIDAGREMGGGQWQALYLVERLENASLLAPEASPLLEEARKRGVDVRPLSLGSLAQAARNADLVHAHDARAHTMAAALPGVRLVVSRRVAFPVKSGPLSRVKYGRAARYLAVSGYVSAQLERAGVPKEKIQVVYDGVPLVEPARGNDVVALASKGTELGRRAAEIAGVQIRFTKQFWQDLSTAQIFVYASEMEGLGSAALAAMSAGVAVVASRVGGLPEAVEHEHTGLLVDNRAEEFAAAINRLRRDPDLAREMGRRGRERVEKQFTIDIMVRQTQAAYAEVLR
jgi:hypothetical protein